MRALLEKTIGVQEVRLKVTIGAPKERVWEALTTGIGDWWPATFYVSGQQPAKYVLEPEVGGRLFEDAGEGKGLCWGQVVTYDPPKTLQVAGDTFPGYGGPGRSFSTYTLSEEGGLTTLDFHHSALGPLDEAQAESMDRGWTFLYEGCLKAHLEGRAAPEWTEGECGS